MSIPTNPQGDPHSTYVLQTRINKDELTRAMRQEQAFTKCMGGTLAEQPDPTRFTHILDIGCGTGSWLIEVAKTYPTIPLLIGIDISSKIIDYAQKQAQKQQVGDRVQFLQMDALRGLTFPSLDFDLVNMRGGGSFLRLWEWPRLFEEIYRVTQPGGLIRLTDIEVPITSTSPALLRLEQILRQVMYHAGYFATPDHSGLHKIITQLLSQYGVQDIQARTYAVEHRSNTDDWQDYYEDMKNMYQVLIPLLNKWTRLPADYQETYQQMLREIQQPDFLETLTLILNWGYKH